MNPLRFSVLTIFLCFVSSSKVIVPLENDNDNLLDSNPTLDGLASGSNSTDDENLTEKTPSTEVPKVSKEVKNGQPIKIPMKCISDYVVYCQSKFFGFRFQDGCHWCNCTKEKTDFCGKGPCQFYARSFDQAVTYCSDVLANNTEDYSRQKAQIRSLARQNRTVVKFETKVPPKNETVNDTTDSANLSTRNVATLTSMKLPEESVNDSSIQAELPKVFSQADSVNDTVKVELPKVMSTNNAERNIVDKKETNSTFDVTRLDRKVESTIKLEKKKSLNKIMKDKREKIDDKANAIQSSLEKISDKKMLRHIIYFIALNELSIKRIIEKTRSHVNNEETKSFRKRLKAIEAKNSMYKSKILKIVKMKLKLTKSNHGEFNHRFNKMFFTKIVRKLNLLNAELHEMKGGVKMWSKMSKTLSNAPGALLKCGCTMKMSFVTVLMISAMATYLLLFP